jgi:hypothetical protein
MPPLRLDYRRTPSWAAIDIQEKGDKNLSSKLAAPATAGRSVDAADLNVLLASGFNRRTPFYDKMRFSTPRRKSDPIFPHIQCYNCGKFPYRELETQ